MMRGTNYKLWDSPRINRNALTHLRHLVLPGVGVNE